MEVKRIWATAVIFVKLVFITSLQIRRGYFHITHRRLAKRCATAVLQEKYVGGRVSEATGKCERLNSTWGLNQTLQSGYAYAKKISVREDFQPAAELNRKPNPFPHIDWLIPGVFRTGVKIDVYVTQPLQRESFSFILVDTWVDFNISIHFETIVKNYNYVQLWIFKSTKGNRGQFWEVFQKGRDTTHMFELPTEFSAGTKCKVSFLVHTDSLEVLVNDKAIKAFRPRQHSLNMTRQIIVYSPIGHADTPLLVHRFEYTEA